MPKLMKGCLWLLGILMLLSIGAGLAVKKFAESNGGADASTARVKLKMLEMTLKIHKWTTGSYPTEEQGLASLFTKSRDDDEKRKAKVQEAIKDPWHRNFIYHIPGKHHPDSYDLYSVGPDGIEDTEDDITNW